MTPLWVASQNNHMMVVKLLIDAGAEVDSAKHSDGATPLFKAAQNGHMSVVKLLLDASARPDLAMPSNGATPLFVAAQNGHVSVARLLVEAGASKDVVRTTDGMLRVATPFHTFGCTHILHRTLEYLLMKAGFDGGTVVGRSDPTVQGSRKRTHRRS